MPRSARILASTGNEVIEHGRLEGSPDCVTVEFKPHDEHEYRQPDIGDRGELWPDIQREHEPGAGVAKDCRPDHDPGHDLADHCRLPQPPRHDAYPPGEEEDRREVEQQHRDLMSGH
jgi:hypothetical protein